MNFKVYGAFDVDLKEAWQNFYLEKGGAYNSSYEWNFTWFKHFGEGKKLFIITGWEENQIRLIAPFYKRGNRLYAVGSNPDFYDSFCVLYQDIACLLDLSNFIIENNFEIDLRLISPGSEFFKCLLRRFEQEKIYKVNIYSYTVKPLIYKTEKFKNSLTKKYKRLKRKENLAKRDFNDELKYDFNSVKNEKHIKEFMNFHQKKWDIFKSHKMRDFIKDLYLNQDFVMLSRLYLKNSDRSVAYSFKYKSLNNVLYSNMFSYNDDFAEMSPGFLVPYYDISSEMGLSVDYMDYGIGSYEYKYYFANKEEIILSIKADLSWKRHKTLFNILKRVKKQISFLACVMK